MSLPRNYRVKTIHMLEKLADEHKAVIIPKSHAWSSPKPASVILHLQGVVILRLIKMGIYVYKRNKDRG